MDNDLITIKKASKILNVSTQTLRRWDESGRLVSVRGKNNYRYYKKEDVEEYIKNNVKDIFKIARNWVLNNNATAPHPDFYCMDISVFQARLGRFKSDLNRIKKLKEIYFLIIAVTGEIGDNSFAHNLGNWPDIKGIFFAYDLNRRKVALADRGQGFLKTLKTVKPELNNHIDALRTGFTEVISGRSPESRGNGLKYVREVITSNDINLFFQTGDAELRIKKGDSNLNIKKSSVGFHGCLALIQF